MHLAAFKNAAGVVQLFLKNGGDQHATNKVMKESVELVCVLILTVGINSELSCNCISYHCKDNLVKGVENGRVEGDIAPSTMTSLGSNEAFLVRNRGFSSNLLSQPLQCSTASYAHVISWVTA